MNLFQDRQNKEVCVSILKKDELLILRAIFSEYLIDYRGENEATDFVCRGIERIDQILFGQPL